MARGRVYTADFSNVSVSATQDLFSIFPGASMAIEIHQINLGQVTQTTIGGLRVRLRRLTGTVAQGSGGTVVTPTPLMPNDVASSVTAHANDTTISTATTFTDLFSDVWNLLNGYLYFPAVDDRPVIKLSTGCVFSLDSAPGSAIVCNGSITFAELF